MRRARYRASALLTTLLVAALALAGCSGDESGDAAPETVVTTHADGTVEEVEIPQEPRTWPLTGLEVKNNASAEARHPMLVIKMDNTPSSSPQVGLGQADLVVEELVEGGVTRLAVFYHSQLPGSVGPVRSMRASDIGIVAPVGASVVTSGAAPVTLRRVSGAGIRFFGEDAEGVYRDNDRSAPYNLFADLQDVAAGIEQKAERPEDYLPWGDGSSLPTGRPASTLSASFGNHTTSWQFRDGTYTNVNSYAADADEFPAETVLVLRVRIGDAGYRDPGGYPVPETKFVGKGSVMLFHDGRVVRGTWAKKELTSPLELSTRDGGLEVPAGHVWIELVPAADGDVTFDK